MKLKRTLFLSLFMMVAMYSLGATVLAAPSQTFPPKFLDGNRINLYEKPYRYPVDEPSYVFQGWIMEDWSQLNSDEKFNLTYRTMSLTIDGVPVKLKKWQHHYPVLEYGGETYYDAKVKIFYVEFPANYFDKGKYVFELRPTNIPTRTVTIKFS
jgi:hypothetical protein